MSAMPFCSLYRNIEPHQLSLLSQHDLKAHITQMPIFFSVSTAGHKWKAGPIPAPVSEGSITSFYGKLRLIVHSKSLQSTSN